MERITLKDHKTLVKILGKTLGRIRLGDYPKPDVVGDYLASTYFYKHWTIRVYSNGCVYAQPSPQHPMYPIYRMYQGKPARVAFWSTYGGCWDEMQGYNTPEPIAAKILDFIERAEKVEP